MFLVLQSLVRASALTGPNLLPAKQIHLWLTDLKYVNVFQVNKHTFFLLESCRNEIDRFEVQSLKRTVAKSISNVESMIRKLQLGLIHSFQSAFLNKLSESVIISDDELANKRILSASFVEVQRHRERKQRLLGRIICRNLLNQLRYACSLKIDLNFPLEQHRNYYDSSFQSFLIYIDRYLIIKTIDLNYRCHSLSYIFINWFSLMFKKHLIVLLVLICTIYSSSIDSQESLAVTIYNNQFAMVKDVRQISFDKGASDLYFTDVSSNIQPATVTFKALNNTNSISVFEQNYEANLVDSFSILKKYVDKNVEIYVKLGQNSRRVTGVLLGYSSGYILKTDQGIEVFNNVQGIKFPSLPEGFFTVPTLNWKVFSQQAVKSKCEVAYRTTGFSWKADYSITLNEQQTKADIGGWVTIDNRSGKRYLNAKLKLIAGDVNTVQENNFERAIPMAMAMTVVQQSAPRFSEKSFSDYHLYTLSKPTSLNDNSEKQVEFIPKVYDLNIRKYNEISISSGGYSENNLKAANKIEFANTKANKLGIPFPKGTIRVFKTDNDDGSLQFIGESSIDHTPKEENITVTTGNAFDIVADKLVTNYRAFDRGGYTASLNLTISNRKDIATEIVVLFNRNQADNLRVDFTTTPLVIDRSSASVWRIRRVFAANEKFSILWNQDFRP